MKTITLLLYLVLGLRVYAEGGIPLWTNRYNGAGNAYDVASRIVVGANGNVFVTGTSGNLFVTGTSLAFDVHSNDWVTVAYSNGGAPLWTNVYDGPAHDLDQPTAMAVGINGNVLVAGISTGPGSGFDYAMIAYSNTGVPLWTNRYNGPGNGVDDPTTVVGDSVGNVFVAGTSYGLGASEDYAIIKYSGAGVPLWTNRYNGPANSYDSLRALVIDASGNLIVSGASTGNGSDYDYATIKFSNAGVPLWTNRYNGPGRDFATAIAVDSGGNVVVTGYSSNIVSGFDYLTIRYSAAGVPLWTNRYNGPGIGGDFPASVSINENGDIFVTGTSLGAGIVTLAYSSIGVPLWTNRYSSQGIFDDVSGPLALDRDGNVFVVVYNGGNFLTLAYSSTGAPLWTNLVSLNGDDGSVDIATDIDGNVFVTGSAAGEPFSPDYVTIKYSSSLRPRLTVQQLNNRMVLTWSTNATGLTLQSTTNLNPPVLWNDSTNTPFRVGNQYTVTNTSTIAAQFFRLKQL